VHVCIRRRTLSTLWKAHRNAHIHNPHTPRNTHMKNPQKHMHTLSHLEMHTHTHTYTNSNIDNPHLFRRSLCHACVTSLLNNPSFCHTLSLTFSFHLFFLFTNSTHRKEPYIYILAYAKKSPRTYICKLKRTPCTHASKR